MTRARALAAVVLGAALTISDTAPGTRVVLHVTRPAYDGADVSPPARGA